MKENELTHGEVVIVQIPHQRPPIVLSYDSKEKAFDVFANENFYCEYDNKAQLEKYENLKNWLVEKEEEQNKNDIENSKKQEIFESENTLFDINKEEWEKKIPILFKDCKNPYFNKLSDEEKTAVIQDMSYNEDLRGEFHDENDLPNDYNTPTLKFLKEKLDYKGWNNDYPYLNLDEEGMKRHYDEVMKEYKEEKNKISNENKENNKEIPGWQLIYENTAKAFPNLTEGEKKNLKEILGDTCEAIETSGNLPVNGYTHDTDKDKGYIKDYLTENLFNKQWSSEIPLIDTEKTSPYELLDFVTSQISETYSIKFPDNKEHFYIAPTTSTSHTLENIPEWAVYYMANGESDTLTAEEKKQIDDYMEKNNIDHVSEISESSYFVHHPEFGPGSDCVDVNVVLRNRTNENNESKINNGGTKKNPEIGSDCTLSLQQLYEHYAKEGKEYNLYDGIYVNTNYGKIRHTNENGTDYYDLYNEKNILACCDGETVTLKKNQAGKKHLINVQDEYPTEFILSDKEFNITTMTNSEYKIEETKNKEIIKNIMTQEENYLKAVDDASFKKQIESMIEKHHATGDNLRNVLSKYNPHSTPEENAISERLESMGPDYANAFIKQIAYEKNIMEKEKELSVKENAIQQKENSLEKQKDFLENYEKNLDKCLNKEKKMSSAKYICKIFDGLSEKQQETLLNEMANKAAMMKAENRKNEKTNEKTNKGKKY